MGRLGNLYLYTAKIPLAKIPLAKIPLAQPHPPLLPTYLDNK